MKKIFLILFIAFNINAKAQQLSKVEIVATGLTCSMCSNAINKQLKSISEVDSVAIDLNKNLFVVYLKKTNKLLPIDLKNKVEKAGFFVGSFVAYINVSNVAITDNTQLDNFVFIDSKPQTINGIVKVKILNKGFVTTKDFKKLQKTYTKYSNFSKDNNKDYYIKLV
jgi:copper chaperone CopZ